LPPARGLARAIALAILHTHVADMEMQEIMTPLRDRPVLRLQPCP